MLVVLRPCNEVVVRSAQFGEPENRQALYSGPSTRSTKEADSKMMVFHDILEEIRHSQCMEGQS